MKQTIWIVVLLLAMGAVSALDYCDKPLESASAPQNIICAKMYQGQVSTKYEFTSAFELIDLIREHPGKEIVYFYYLGHGTTLRD